MFEDEWSEEKKGKKEENFFSLMGGPFEKQRNAYFSHVRVVKNSFASYEKTPIIRGYHHR